MKKKTTLIVLVVFAFAVLFVGCDSSSSSATNNNDYSRETTSTVETTLETVELSYEEKLINALEQCGYVVKRNIFSFSISSPNEIGKHDLSIYGPGSLVAKNIYGCSLSAGQYAFANDNGYKECCDALIQIFGIDDSMDHILSTFNEETKLSQVFSNDRFVWYLRFTGSTSNNFEFKVFDLESIVECREKYDLNNYVDFIPAMLEQLTIYSGSKVKFVGELIESSDVQDDKYAIKKSLKFKTATAEEIEVFYDFGYFPYTFVEGSQYEIYGVISDGGIKFDFLKEVD